MNKTKTKKFLIVISIIIFLAGGIIALNTTSTGYQVLNSDSKRITAWNIDYQVYAGICGSTGIFVPTATSSEYNSFISNPPPCIDLAPYECSGTLDCAGLGETYCDTIAGCSWDLDLSKCLGDPINPDCGQFTLETDCDNYPVYCIWEAGAII